MKNKRFIIVIFLSICFVVVIFKEWFLNNLITAGDYWPLFKSMYDSRSLPLLAWDFNGGYGLGGFSGPFLWIHLNLSTPITVFGSVLGSAWVWVERLGHMYPFILLTFISPYLLTKYLLRNSLLALFSACIYLLNTYALMIAGGGQFAGVGMGYALLPLVILLALKLIETEKQKLYISILAGLVFGMQTIYDIRFAYISIFATAVLLALNSKKVLKKAYVVKLLIVAGISILLNLFWLLPSAVVYQNPFNKLGSAYSSIDAVRFFSFAKLENTISLLHPNWPENIFGKVGFMKPEFLILPILAFASLFYISKAKNKLFLGFFVAIGLLGAFLAKGANEPLGFIYMLAFEHVPGFQLFRDPTKWYTLVALSYSVLVPFSVGSIYGTIKANQRLVLQKTHYVFFGVVILYFIVLIRPAIFGELNGAFKPVTIPAEYTQLEKQLSSDNEFYRTLWIPNYQRFSYYSATHPSISGNDFLKAKTSNEAIANLQSSKGKELLEFSSVRYVIVPLDSEKEIFLRDRKYDEKQRREVIEQLRKTSWLNEVFDYNNLAVFENISYKEHFWSLDQGLIVRSSQHNVTQYNVKLTNAVKGSVLVFSESFDENWIARKENALIKSSEFSGFNSFVLPKDGTFEMSVEYAPQRWVIIGSVISLFTLFVSLMLLGYSLFFSRRKNEKKKI